ncbi:MAG: Ldh family oxidoreductase [Rhodospirillaceae bacterium]
MSAKVLDADTAETVRLTVAQAETLAHTALQRIGFDADEARVIAAHLIDAALCGYRFAGLPRILTIAEDPRTREPHHAPRILHETDVSAMMDGGNYVGYYSVYQATQVAIEKARKHGFSIVGMNNSHLSGRNSYYLELIARAGFAGIHLASAPPVVVPLGGRKPALGTNPIALGVPGDPHPLIFDMGTAALMRGEVILRKRTGTPLPDGAGIDASGKETHDAAAVLDGGGILPFGGYKGFGLSVVIQAMCLMAGAALPRGKVQDYAFLFVVFDPGLLMPREEFARQLEQLKAAIKGVPRQPGCDDIRLPSERAFREREQRRREGIVIDRKVHDAIAAL